MNAPAAIRFIALASLIAGCGESGEDTPRAAQQPAPPLLESEIPFASIGLVDQTLHREPEKGDWQGEVFNDLAGEQLKQIGKRLATGDTSLDGIAMPAATGALAPASTTVASRGTSLTVRRGNIGAAIPLPEALAALVAPFGAENELQTEFKIYRVLLDEKGKPVCEARVAIDGQTKTGSTLSRHASWRCTWSWDSPEVSPLLTSVVACHYEEVERTGGGFVDATGSVFAGVGEAFAEQFGHSIDHWAARLESRYGIGLAGWHGLAIGDANGDGIDDLYVCEPGGLPNRLYIAKSDGMVTDASSNSGADFKLQTQSALFVDLDNDGDQDLVLATTPGIVFLEGNGRGEFAVKGQKLVPEAAPLCLAAADFDLDGDLDLYAGCYSPRQSSVDGVQILGRPIPYHDANNGGRNVLFRNDGDWKFTDVTQSLGLDVNNRRFTLAASWEDYDGDGDPDLYVANDYGRNNLYRNDSNFADVAKAAGVEDISAGMSVSWGDPDGDGDSDLYVSNMWSSAGNRIAYQRNFLTGADDTARGEFQRHARGNSLFTNNGDGTFTDSSVAAGVTMGRWAWGSIFTDFDNDGWQDIAVANGFITQPDDSGDL